MKNLLFILFSLALTGVYGQEIELAVGIDSAVINPSEQFCNGRYMQPLEANADTSKGMKRNLYYRIGNDEWSKINRKSRKELGHLLSRNTTSYMAYRKYDKKIRSSNRILIGSFVVSGITYFAPGGRLLVFVTLGSGTKWSYDKRKEAQRFLIESIESYNQKFKDHIPIRSSIIANY